MNDQLRIIRMSQSSPLWGHQCLQRSLCWKQRSLQKAENLVFRDLLPPLSPLFFSLASFSAGLSHGLLQLLYLLTLGVR